MPNFQRKTAVEQVADAIAEDISAGRLVGLLPSIRILSERYDLSVPTLHKARALLVQRGVLERRGDKRRLSIVPPAGLVPEVRPVSLMIFWGEDPDMLYSNITLPLQSVSLKLRKQGRASECVNLHGLTPDQVRERISASISLHKPTHCILVFGTQEMLQQIHRAKVSLALIGGNLKVPSHTVRIGVDFPPLIEHSVVQLKALGHRCFFVPYLRRDGAAREATAEIRRIEEAHGVDILVHWSQDMPESDAKMYKQLDEALTRRATAVLFPNWTDFIFAIGYAAKRNLVIPRDFSVVVLNNFSTGHRYRPAVAHFICKSEVLKQQVLSWIDNQLVSRAAYARHMISTWNPGESIGPAPQVNP